MKSTSLLAAALCASLAACAGSHAARYDRTEFAGRQVSTPTTSIPLTTADDDQLGIVEVSTSGAFVTQLGKGHGTPVVHIRLTVRNVDVNSFRVPLDQLRLEGTWAEPLRPVAIFCRDKTAYATSVTIPAGEAREVDVVFALPDGTKLDTLPGYFLTWGVDLPGDLVREKTAFRPAGKPMGNMARAFRPTEGNVL